MPASLEPYWQRGVIYVGFWNPVNADERDAAIKRVESGQGSNRDREIATEAAKQAGSVGNRANAALKKDAEKANQPRGLFG